MVFEKFKEKLREDGVVGAGGAGFPTYEKIFQKGKSIIMNAAECEPLFKVDQQLLRKYPYEILKGFNEVLETCEMESGILALKNSYVECITALNKYIDFFPKLEIIVLEDVYPLGDEVVLLYEITGVVIPQGKIPKDFGYLILNVETCYNIYKSIFEDIPVTTSHLTVSGMVKNPKNFEVKIGTSVDTILKKIEILSEDEYEIILGGPLTGEIGSRESIIGKTTKGILLLPKDKKVAAFKRANFHSAKKQAKSSCSQCRNCTDLCPRYLLGHGIEPHKIMNTIIYGGNYKEITGVHACCQCNLCTLYSCHQELDPLRIIKELKGILRDKNIGNMTEGRGVSKEREYRKLSGKMLKQKLGISKYDKEALDSGELEGGNILKISLHQGIGVHSLSRVKIGEIVHKNQIIGDFHPDKLGINLHSPVNGVVLEVDKKYILIKEV